MVVVTNGMKLLRAFLRAHRITPTSAARSINVSHVTMLAYLSGEKRPESANRDAIARWTAEYVPRDSWRTRGEQRELERVVPMPTDATGTEG